MSREVVLTLFIDDNEEFVETMKRILGEAPCYDYQIMSLRSMRTAKPLLGRHNIDLILMDLDIPDSQGIESLNEIKLLAPDTPVIVRTGTGDDQTMAECLKRASDYLVKCKLTDIELRDRVRSVVAKHRARRDLKPLDTAMDKMDALLERCEQSPHLPPYKRGSGASLLATPEAQKTLDPGDASNRPSDPIDMDDTTPEPKN